MSRDYFGNIIVYHKTTREDLRDRLQAFRCPACRSIFTIELEPGKEWRLLGSYSFGCPICNVYRNWCEYRCKISISKYKFLRWWFGVRDKWIKRKELK